MKANLSCYRVACGGEFRHVDGDTFECRECGAELRQRRLERIAEGDDSLADVASAILGGEGR